MALYRPIVDISGNLIELPDGDYIKPNLLGSNIPTVDTVLTGNNTWVMGASFNYWTKTGNDLSYVLGNVGIGTTNPTTKLEVVTGSIGAFFTRIAEVPGATTPAFGIGTASTTTRIYSYGDALQVFTGLVGSTATQKMTILADGKVGIGVSTPITILDVRGQVSANSGSLTNPAYSFVGDLNTGMYSPSADALTLVTNGVNRLNISNVGDVNIGGAAGTNSLIVNKFITGDVDASGIRSSGQIQSDVTNSAFMFRAVVNQANFALPTLIVYESQIGTVSGTGTLFVNFRAQANPTGFTNVYGFQSTIASGTNRYGAYFNGTAQNHFRGNVGIGAGSTVPTTELDVIGTTRLTNTNAFPLEINRGLNVKAVGSASVGIKLGALDVATYKEGATLFGQLDADGNNGRFFVQVRNENVMTTYLTILSSGNIGIGTTNAVEKVTIGTGASNHKILIRGTVADVEFGNDTIGLKIGTVNNANIYFTTNAAERARITNNGRFLVGYTSETNAYKMQIDSGSTTGNGLYVNGNIRATGNIIADGYFSGTSSDRIYKSNFKEVSVYNVIDNIGVSSYKHKLYDNKRLIGSVAQDIQKYFPELITEDSNGRLRVDNYGYAALALQLGKETKTEVERLKERVKELETRLGI